MTETEMLSIMCGLYCGLMVFIGYIVIDMILK